MKTNNYDLEERTLNLALRVRNLCRSLKYDILNTDDIKQVLRSSASIGANYIEANDSISKKDFIHRIKICRKESKETIFWLRVIDLTKYSELDKVKAELINEATQIMKIFGAIYQKSV